MSKAVGLSEAEYNKIRKQAIRAEKKASPKPQRRRETKDQSTIGAKIQKIFRKQTDRATNS